MNDCTDTPYPRNYSFTSVSPGVRYPYLLLLLFFFFFDVERYDINPTGKKNYTMSAIECIHPVPCVGYCFWEPRSKLKEEYKEMDGKKIGQLRKSGVEVSEVVEQPMFVFMGDTAAKVFDVNPYPLSLFSPFSPFIYYLFDYFRQLFTFPVIIIECTFLHEDKPHEAEERGHTSWDDLKPYVVANPQTTFVIIHFSLRYLLPPAPLSSLLPPTLTFRFRYSNADIDAHFKKENLSNVVAWCDVD